MPRLEANVAHDCATSLVRPFIVGPSLVRQRNIVLPTRERPSIMVSNHPSFIVFNLQLLFIDDSFKVIIFSLFGVRESSILHRKCSV